MSQPYNQPKPGGYNPYSSPTPGGGGPYYSGQGEAHRGTMILVFGILGLVMCPILGVVAWVMGRSDIAKMDAGQMDPTGRGNTQAGMICGIIASVLLVLQLAAVCCYFGFIFTMIGAAGGANAAGL
ncbi:MAG: DUF4190 domain-containing protein [Pirellulaceae bacterium]|nr:DUF4190 domain-containing protein [Pirellulaceae bacterium]